MFEIIKEYNKFTRREELSLDEAINIYKNKCFNWDLNSGIKLIRNIWSNDAIKSYSYLNPKGKNRISRNTSNEYNNLISNILENWKDYPKRSESNIMSLTYDEKPSYDYICIPFNNSKLAVSSGVDFWWSFISSGIDSMDELNRHFLSRLNHPKFNNIKISDIDSKELLKIPYSDEGINVDDYMEKYMIMWKKSGENLYDFLYDLLDPVKNGFVLINSNDVQSNSNFLKEGRKLDREAWGSGEFLIIYYDSYWKFMKKLEGN